MARRRPVRSVAWLVALLWLLQVGAQVRAVQCAVWGGPERWAPQAGPIDPPPMPAPMGDTAFVAADPAKVDCPVGAWCEMGQWSMLPPSVPSIADHFLQPMAAGPPFSRTRFLRSPGDRPPAA